MTQLAMYPIGIPGQKWGEKEKAAWLSKQSVKRSYPLEVVAKIDALRADFDVEQYGELKYSDGDYPLFALKTRAWDAAKATILVTGGVHGYETSGVQGAIRFLETRAQDYSEHFNIVVAPCLSPWGYETINRWTPNAVDPNRSFYEGSPAEESTKLMRYVAALNTSIVAHIDLHETTDTDNSEFRPALDAREGKTDANHGIIPDGFYLVGDSDKPVVDFQRAVIERVATVTHIAPPDEGGCIIDVAVAQHGVVNYAVQTLGLCTGFTGAAYTTTTEVYPDSPKVDDENCIVAQVASIIGALDYLIAVK